MIVNGRFLAPTPTGLHRVARNLLDAARATGWTARVWAPAGVDDPRVDRWLASPPGPGTHQAFEQVVLPAAARGREVLSLTNTAPLALRRSTVMVHDLAPVVGPAWFTPRMRWYGSLVRAAARRAERVLTVSRATADDLRSAGVTAPISVVHPSVDHLPGPSTDDEVARALGGHDLRPDVPYLLFVGWADPRKDLVTAVAAHRLARRVVDHRLVLVGLAHPTFAPVVAPTDATVRRLGFVSDEDLRALLTGAAALVYPTRYEGFGLPPLEAAACGTPALASDLPVLHESAGSAATFVPPGDVAAWAEAMVAALRGEVAPGGLPTRTWADAGHDLVAALA